MKRSLSFFALATSLIFSFTAAGESRSYSGAGQWKSTGDSSGTYTVEATIEKNDDTADISQVLTFGDRTLSVIFKVKKISDNFYTMLDKDDNEIGSGYCFIIGPQEKICHSEAQSENAYVENTLRITADKIYRLGSKTDLDSLESFIWTDVLEAH